jgi:hypothetical protein
VKPWLTEPEVAADLGCHAETLRRLRRQGLGPKPEGWARNMPIYARTTLPDWQRALDEHRTQRRKGIGYQAQAAWLAAERL